MSSGDVVSEVRASLRSGSVPWPVWWTRVLGPRGSAWWQAGSWDLCPGEQRGTQTTQFRLHSQGGFWPGVEMGTQGDGAGGSPCWGRPCGSLAVGSRKAGDATLIYSTESGGRSQGHALRFSGVPGRHSPSFPVHTLSSALCCPAWLRVAVSAEA